MVRNTALLAVTLALVSTLQARSVSAASDDATTTEPSAPITQLDPEPEHSAEKYAESRKHKAQDEFRSDWYGGTILGSDLVAVGLLSLAIVTGKGTAPLAMAALGVYAFAPPIVHATHHNDGAALTSVGIRLGVPLSAALLGAAIGYGADRGCSGDGCGLAPALGGLVGFAAGAIAASAIDIGALAYKRIPERTTPYVALVPTIDPKRNSAGVSVQGVW